ncbi:ComF family protein [Pararhizobium capsulatum DSM 1112]|uniref:ComF family protein n=1 Tax=Pararhizobium capsulatum DSM 1112 TaxID=1121113 RepID=A0ABU0BUD9_9HYPH|nr:ComF family protein [Pararhizobium capsulatum]MDQ0321587.1 ComF family protein [Pararhizobium capsulatum DSM 1112]
MSLRSRAIGWAGGWAVGFRRLAGAAVDFVYPPVCTGCGVIVSRHGGVCGARWPRLRLIERPYCEVLGLPFSHDLGKGILSADAIADPPVFDRLRSVAIHDGIARSLVHDLKYRDRTDLALMMAGWMIRASDGAVADCEAIVPVPLHAFRLWSRRYNQSAELARAIARMSGKPHLPTALLRTRRTRQQVGLGVAARRDNVQGAFSVPEAARDQLFGRHIVLVDNVYTTGATVSAATRALKRAGAAEVTVLTFARAISGLI